MKLAEDISETLRPDRLVRGIQAVLVAIFGYGVIAGRVSVVVNSSLALAITFFPVVLRWRYDHETDPHLVLWVSVAALVHAAGALGPYSAQTGILAWYDSVAHAISAAFVAGVGYAFVVGLDRGSRRIEFPEEFRFVFTLFFILAFGVAWEIMEFAASGTATLLGGTEVIVQYGIDDTVNDLVFNALAAAIVAIWGTGYFRDVASLVTSRFRRSGQR